jgi:hypothetical protein
MGDNHRRYRAIKTALKQLYPKTVKGNQARHMNTLAALISGIVGSRRVSLPDVASKVPDGTARESRVKRLARWMQNERITADLYFMPYAEALLTSLAERTLVLAMDGSDVGRGCMALMVSVVYQKRALPLAWVVASGNKGHFPEDTHVRLLEQVQALVPEGADVIFLGDGEFDGVALQAALTAYDWNYVCRTAKNIQLCEEGDWFTFADLGITPGDCISIPDVQFTQHAYGPVLAVAWWDTAYDAPLYLVTNLELAEEACFWYRKRFRIETFFSDQKTRGFHLNKSHFADPQRLARLMLAACLAYLWIIFLGVVAQRDGWLSIIHRSDRCDLSLFQLGLILLDHFLNEGLPIPVAFQVPLPEVF